MTGVALVATTGLAFAEVPPAERTVFSWGYDVDFQSFVFNTATADGPEDCGYGGNQLRLGYGVDEDGSITSVEVLTDEEEAAEEPAAEEAVVNLAADPEVDDPCALRVGEVAGPNGQVNHGMFMKLINEMWEGEGGRGCINRVIAQTDLGQGEQQVRVSDLEDEGEADEPAEAPVDGEGDAMIGEVDFESVEIDCQAGNGPDQNGDDNDKKPEKAEKPEKPGQPEGGENGNRGRSGDAPGRNK